MMLPTTFLPYNLSCVGPQLAAAVTSAHSTPVPPDGSRSLIRRKLYRYDRKDVYTYFILGLGNADYALELLSDWSQQVLVVVLEHDAAAVRYVLERRNLTPYLHSGKLAIFLNPTRTELFSALMPAFHRFFVSTGDRKGYGVRIITHPSALNNPTFFHEQLLNVMSFYDHVGTGLRTSMILTMNTKQNLLANIGDYVWQSGLRPLENKLKGQPAIIISAGPSLEKNIDQLVDARRGNDTRGVTLIAVGTIYKHLRRVGIVPDFVVSLDYHAVSGRYLADAPTDGTTLVAEPKISCVALSKWKGEKILLGNDFLNVILAPLHLDRPCLPGSGCVAHLAYYLAEWLGADPIVFVGQDLSFKEPTHTHAEGADAYYPTDASEGIPVPRLKVKDMCNNDVYTDVLMHSYAVHFERAFAETKTRIINATEGGILTEGCECLPFKQALSSLGDAYAQLRTPPSPSGETLPTPEAVIAVLDAFIAKCHEAIAVYEDAMPIMEKRLECGEGDEALRAEHQEINAKINALGAMAAMFANVSQRSEFRKGKADMQIYGAGLKGKAFIVANIKRDLAYVRELNEGAKTLVSMIEKAKERLNDPK